MLSALYRQRIAPLLKEQVVYFIAPLKDPEQELPRLLSVLETADVVVDQKFDSPDAVPEGFFDGRSARRVRFPYLSGRFYWPYTGAVHARMPAPEEDGILFPYVSEIGDALVNQAILDEVPADEALRRYDATVAGGASRILRLAELHMEMQRNRDAACDLHFADFIAANYRSEPLFLTQGHPGLTLTKELVRRVFLAIDVPYSLVDATLRSMRVSPFPIQELPIHPGVAETLGLTFVTEGRRYGFHNEGSFTFAEYVGRYLAGTWEPDLERGMRRYHAGDSEGALQLMQPALRRCPGSPAAWRIVALALFNLGRHEAADEAMAVAIERDPQNPDTYASLATMCGRRRDFVAAEAAARRAIELFPFVAAGHRALADVMARQERYSESAAVARFVAANDPADGKEFAFLAHHLLLAGDLREAEWQLRRALELDPKNAGIQRQVAELEARLARAGSKAA